MYDVIILGGGLAGLGLARQLNSATPELSILILEKQRFPRALGVAKVGESTVEIGSHYLSRHLGLKAHLQSAQLKKFGVRLFMGAAGAEFHEQDELGTSENFNIPTYQIDRGLLENTLAEQLRADGVVIVDGVEIGEFDCRSTLKSVQYQRDGLSTVAQSHWLVDAAGRAALIKTQQQLQAESEHKANAVWFRIDRRIEIDSWSDSKAWRVRCRPEGHRWLSTNHLVGPGYWVWIIPLSSGITSIGIVMDDQAFTEAAITDVGSAMTWLNQHQPRCARAVDGATFLDFAVLRDYAYDCKQVFSSERWAITGEAGVFADPLYSPGSDFIAIGNQLISTLILSERRGEDIRFSALLFEKLFKSVYSNTLSVYVDQYGGFGDRRMMGLKLLWDYSYYWGILCVLFFRNIFTDIAQIRELNPLLESAQSVNKAVQAAFRLRAQKRLVLPTQAVFVDQYQIPCLRHFNMQLLDDTTPVADILKGNIAKIQGISTAVLDMLSAEPSRAISPEEESLLGRYRESILR